MYVTRRKRRLVENMSYFSFHVLYALYGFIYVFVCVCVLNFRYKSISRIRLRFYSTLDFYAFQFSGEGH